MVITVWYVWDLSMKMVEFSHISDGYDPDATEPEPVTPAQRRAWAGRAWTARRAELVDGKVVSA